MLHEYRKEMAHKYHCYADIDFARIAHTSRRFSSGIQQHTWQLVSLFHNLRLLKRMKKPKYSEPMVAWGDSDELDVDKSRVRTYAPSSSAFLL